MRLQVAVVLLSLLLQAVGHGNHHHDHDHNKNKGLRYEHGTGFALRYQELLLPNWVELPDFTIGAPMTFEAIIRPRALQLSGGCIMELATGHSHSYENSIRVCAEGRQGGVQRLAVHTKAVGGSYKVTIDENDNPERDTLFTDEWNYIAVTIDTNRRVELYRQEGNTVHRLREEFLPSDQHVPTIVRRTRNFFGHGSPLCFFNGDIDEVLLWNRVVFGHQLKAFRPIPHHELNTLIAYWPFDEGSGKKAKSEYASLDGSLKGLFNKPKWIPVNPISTSSCKLWAHLNLRTFDSRTLPTIPVSGEYWLARSPVSLEGERPIAVQGRFNPSPHSHFNSLIGIAFQHEGDILEVGLDFAHYSNSKIFFNGQALGDNEVFLDNGITILKKYKGKHGEHTIDINVPEVLTLELKAKPKHLKNEMKLLIRDTWKVTLPNMESDYMGGLCGNFNGNKHDDDFEDIALPVDPSDSFFDNPVDFDPPGEPIVCDIETTEEPFQSQALAACSFSDQNLTEACLNDVCSSGDLSAAAPYAQIDYEDCLAAFLASNDTEVEFTCDIPCPNFCSFNGECKEDGVCECHEPFTGIDCSQLTEFPCFEASWGDGTVIPIEPFSGSDSVQQHYSYANPSWSSANTGNEISDAIVMYLYEERDYANPSNSKHSLVFINDKAKDGSGGRTEVDIAVSGNDLEQLAILVKDDPYSWFDRINMNSDKSLIEARWKWWRCCTDGMALGTLPDDFSLNFTFTRLNNIDQIYVSQQNHFGAQDIFGYSAEQTTGLRITGSICENNCGQYTNCSACSEQPSCGWCDDSGTCEYGNPAGPRDGTCGSWRFSKEDTEARVFLSTIDYPVNPSDISVILPTPLDVQVSVHLPEPEQIPLEVVFLQDVSKDFGNQLSQIKGGALQVYSSIQELYPRSRLGLGSFSDQPVLPYGNPGQLDYSYATDHPLSTNTNSIQDALNNLAIVDGGDSKNSQLIALMQVATSEDMEWTDNARHIVLVVTNTRFHEFPTPNYPSRDEVREALLARNIVPIFVVASHHLGTYRSLVDDLGFGYASSSCGLSPSSIFTEIKSALKEQSSSVKAIVRANGRLQDLTPLDGYSGISSNTRVVFNARLNPSSGTDGPTLITFPGYGHTTITPSVSDLPETATCPYFSFVGQNTSQAILTLTGSSMYGTVSAIITALPDGELYQVENETTRGEQITELGTRVDDTLNRVFFVPGSGDTSISYKLHDYCEACSPERTCQIKVQNVNQPPTATPVPTNLHLDQDTDATIVLGGTDPEDSAIVSVIVEPPSNGKLYDEATGVELIAGSTLSPGFVARFVPTPGTFGNPNSNDFYTLFRYKVVDNDGTGMSSPTKRVDVFVTRVNIPPTAESASYSLVQDSSLQIALEGSDDLGSSQLTYFIHTLPPSGTLEDLTTGNEVDSENFELGGNLIRYTPNPAFHGNDSFTFRVVDGDGDPSAPALISMLVIHVNHPPEVYGLGVSTNESQPLDISLLNQASDIDGDDLAMFICNWNGRGTLLHGGLEVPKNESNVAIPSGEVTYHPPPYENGPNFAAFTFSAMDPSGESSSCAVVEISVLPVPDEPTTVNPGPVYTPEETAVSITIRGYDKDTDLLSITICQSVEHGNLQLTTPAHQNPSDLTETIAVYLYTPTVDFFGVDSFHFTVADDTFPPLPCEPVSIYVNGTNDPPTVSPVQVNTTENTEVTFVLSASDQEDDTHLLDIIIASLPESGSLWNNGEEIPSPNFVIVGNNVTYRPEPSESGHVNFLYRARDTEGALSGLSSVDILIEAVNQEPEAHSASVFTQRNVAKVIAVSGFDREDGASVTIHIDDLPESGSLQLCDDIVCANPTAIGQDDVVSTKLVLYTPNQNFFGLDDFSIYASDSEGLVSPPALIEVNVTFVNIPPTADPSVDWYSTDEATPVELVLEGSDVDGPVTFSISHLNFLGSLTTLGGQPIVAGETVESPVVYTPTSNSNNTQPFAVITYRVTDSHGAFVTADLKVNVTALPDLPDAPTFEVTGIEDVPLVIVLTGDGNGLPITDVRIISLPNGTLTQFNDSEAIEGTPTSVADPLDRIMFIPALYDNGFPLTKFSYEVVTSAGASSGEVIINVEPVNNPPTIDVFLPTVLEDGNITFALEGDDVDLDREGDELRAVVLEVPSTLFGRFYQVDNNSQPLFDQLITGFHTPITNKDRLIYFEPTLNSNDDVTIIYQILDKEDEFALAQITIQVIPVNDPPVANPRTYIGFDDREITNVLLSFSDADKDDLIGEFVTLPERGTLYLEGEEVTLETQFTQDQKQFEFRAENLFEFASPYANFSYFVSDYNSSSEVVVNFINILYRNRPPTYSGVTNLTLLEDDPVGVEWTLEAEDDGPLEDIIFTLTTMPLPEEGTLYNQRAPPSEVWDALPYPLPIGGYTLFQSWNFRFIPAEDHNTDEIDPVRVGFKVRDADIGNPVEAFVEITIIGVNDPPEISSDDDYQAAPADSEKSIEAVPAVITSIVISDDAVPNEGLFHFRMWQVGAVSLTLRGSEDFEGFFSLGANPATISDPMILEGTLSQINIALSKGVVFEPIPEFVGVLDGILNMRVNDSGNAGLGGPEISEVHQILIELYEAGELEPIEAAGALVGVTTLLSLGIFGTYKVLKRRKIIPEEADPWENDELFDATLENPLFSGGPSSLAAVYESDQE